jgi:hypothetical protein
MAETPKEPELRLSLRHSNTEAFRSPFETESEVAKL